MPPNIRFNKKSHLSTVKQSHLCWLEVPGDAQKKNALVEMNGGGVRRGEDVDRCQRPRRKTSVWRRLTKNSGASGRRLGSKPLFWGALIGGFPPVPLHACSRDDHARGARQGSYRHLARPRHLRPRSSRLLLFTQLPFQRASFSLETPGDILVN